MGGEGIGTNKQVPDSLFADPHYKYNHPGVKHFLLLVYSPNPMTNVIVLVCRSSLRMHSSLFVTTCHPLQTHSSWFGDFHHSPDLSTIVHNTCKSLCLFVDSHRENTYLGNKHILTSQVAVGTVKFDLHL